MQKNLTSRSYSLTSYDQYLCLKPPLMLWITCLYLSRALALPLFSGLASWSGTDTASLSQGAFQLSAMPPALPAFLVLMALLTRSPSRGRFARWIWANSRTLLGLSAILDLALPGVLLLLGDGHALKQTLGRLLSEAFDLYFLLFIACSQRTRDVFRSYPEAAAAGESGTP
jgi:hypothetical protein